MLADRWVGLKFSHYFRQRILCLAAVSARVFQRPDVGGGPLESDYYTMK
jgi:hypothetical protein